MTDTIPNWTFFGATAKIDLFKHVCDEETFYSPTVTFWLDANDDEERVITLITEIYEDCPVCAARFAFSSISELFDVCENVLILDDKSGDVIGEFEIFSEDAIKWSNCEK